MERTLRVLPREHHHVRLNQIVRRRFLRKRDADLTRLDRRAKPNEYRGGEQEEESHSYGQLWRNYGVYQIGEV